MLHHISIGVDNPSHVAEILTKIFQGKFFPFPVHEGSYMVVAGDEVGTAIELYPSGTELIIGETEVSFAHNPSASKHNSVHAAISVPSSQETIEAIGNEEGWKVRLCDRGPFSVIEFWLENQLMLELLPPELVEKYLNFMQPKVYEEFLTAAMSANNIN